MVMKSKLGSMIVNRCSHASSLQNFDLEGYTGQFLTLQYEYRKHTPAKHNPDKLALIFGVYFLGKRRGEVAVFTEVAPGSIREPNKMGKNPKFTPIENRGIWKTLVQNDLLPDAPPSRIWRYFDKAMKSHEWVARVTTKQMQATTLIKANTRELWCVDRAPKEYAPAAYRDMYLWFHGYDYDSPVAPVLIIDNLVPF